MQLCQYLFVKLVLQSEDYPNMYEIKIIYVESKTEE